MDRTLKGYLEKFIHGNDEQTMTHFEYVRLSHFVTVYNVVCFQTFKTLKIPMMATVYHGHR